MSCSNTAFWWNTLIDELCGKLYKTWVPHFLKGLKPQQYPPYLRQRYLKQSWKKGSSCQVHTSFCYLGWGHGFDFESFASHTFFALLDPWQLPLSLPIAISTANASGALLPMLWWNQLSSAMKRVCTNIPLYVLCHLPQTGFQLLFKTSQSFFFFFFSELSSTAWTHLIWFNPLLALARSESLVSHLPVHWYCLKWCITRVFRQEKQFSAEEVYFNHAAVSFIN